MKIGCVIPVYKKGQKDNPNNYRPITKLSNIDKIFEEAIMTRFKAFLNVNNIIDEKQFGFVEKSNTLAAAINFTEHLYQQIDKKKYIAIVSIDLQKAFDSVQLDCLIDKIAALDISDK